MQPVQAQVLDSNHLELKQPIEIEPGSNIVVMIMSPEESESQSWYQLSLQGLASAYADNEPEYSAELVKAKNPDFRHE